MGAEEGMEALVVIMATGEISSPLFNELAPMEKYGKPSVELGSNYVRTSC